MEHEHNDNETYLNNPTTIRSSEFYGNMGTLPVDVALSQNPETIDINDAMIEEQRRLLIAIRNSGDCSILQSYVERAARLVKLGRLSDFSYSVISNAADVKRAELLNN
jgi:hypothetical protein